MPTSILDELDRAQAAVDAGIEARARQQHGIDLGRAVLDFEALLKEVIPQPVLLAPWLPEGGLSMVFARPGIGKTFFGLGLGVALACADETFLGWPISEGGVLILDGEMMLHEERERMAKFVHRQPVHPLLLLSHQKFFQTHERDLDISDIEVQAGILELVNHNPGIKLVIFDNLSTLCTVREDHADDWNNLVQPFLLRLRRRGIAVLLVHHANKGGESQSGTGARSRVLHAEIRLSRPDGGDSNEGAHFRVDFVKSRVAFGESVQPIDVRLIERDGLFTWETTSIEESTADRLVELIRECGSDGILAKDAAEELGVSAGYLSKLKAKLVKDGILLNTDRQQPLQLAARNAS